MHWISSKNYLWQRVLVSLHMECQVVRTRECAWAEAENIQGWWGDWLGWYFVMQWRWRHRWWWQFCRHFFGEGCSVTCRGHQALHLAFIRWLRRINGVSTSLTLLWQPKVSITSDAQTQFRQRECHPVSIFKTTIADYSDADREFWSLDWCFFLQSFLRMPLTWLISTQG